MVATVPSRASSPARFVRNRLRFALKLWLLDSLGADNDSINASPEIGVNGIKLRTPPPTCTGIWPAAATMR